MGAIDPGGDMSVITKGRDGDAVVALRLVQNEVDVEGVIASNVTR